MKSALGLFATLGQIYADFGAPVASASESLLKASAANTYTVLEDRTNTAAAELFPELLQVLGIGGLAAAIGLSTGTATIPKLHLMTEVPNQKTYCNFHFLCFSLSLHIFVSSGNAGKIKKIKRKKLAQRNYLKR